MKEIDIDKHGKQFSMHHALSIALLAVIGLTIAESSQARKQVLDRVVVRGDRGSWGWDFLWEFGTYYAHGIHEPDYYFFPDHAGYDPGYYPHTQVELDARVPDPDDCNNNPAAAGRNILIGNPVVAATGNKMEYEQDFMPQEKWAWG
ncbi:hypothetical protein CO608_09490 [Lysobacteraceae bacterium NML08-0793]|nr:hypothetical protein CO608_09490 [Xanthomonadaceae bacterium NML08-0793]